MVGPFRDSLADGPTANGYKSVSEITNIIRRRLHGQVRAEDK